MTISRGVRLACGFLLLAAPSLAGSTGTLSGTVRLAGPAPKRPLLEVFKHEEVCGKGVPDDRLVVSGTGGVRWAVVTVDGVPAGAPRPQTDPGVVLDNHTCRFAPHVLVAEVGQTLELHNSDPILHNADARLGQETTFNVALPPDKLVHTKLDRPGTLAVTCDVRHSWMSAFIVVANHPFHTATDAYGAYQIDELPPGTYTVRVWHEELGTQEQPVTIEAGKVTTLDVTYPATAAIKPGP
jgi:plastocyanin